MTIHYLPSAEADLIWFARYYREIFPAGGTRAAQALKQAEDLLRSNPASGRIVEEFETCRRLRIQRTPFSLIYRVTAETIDILRVWDSRQEFLNLR